MFLPVPTVSYSLLDNFIASGLLDCIGRFPGCGKTGFKPFFIIGSGRCGSTLLRRVLNAHPHLVIPPETHVLGKAIFLYRIRPWRSWAGRTKDVHALFQDSLSLKAETNTEAVSIATQASDRSLAAIVDSLYRSYAYNVGKDVARWGDKSPINVLWLNSLLSIFPDAQFIHILRNGFDVVASMMQSNLSPNLRHAAYRWKISVQLCRNLENRLNSDQYSELKYEEFVKAPRSEIERICRFLGTEFHPEMIGNSDAERLKDIEQHQHLKGVNRPITASSVGKANQSLTADQWAEAYSIFHRTLHDAGYAKQS